MLTVGAFWGEIKAGVGKIREFGENPKQSRYCNRNETAMATI